MNIFSKTLVFLFLAAIMLASCNSAQSTPTVSQAEIMETAISTVSTALAQTQMDIPTSTPMALPTFPLPTAPPTSVPTLRPSPTPLVFTDPSIPLSERIVYYYFVNPAESPSPEGRVGGLAPTYADETFTSDTAADLRRALEIVLHDARNFWRGSDLEIVDVTFRNGHADIVLQGEYFAAGGGPLWAASWQILMTVFANPSVQTATISINGGAIGNLGISNSRDAKPANYVYTRAEIETFMNENAYVSS